MTGKRDIPQGPDRPRINLYRWAAKLKVRPERIIQVRIVPLRPVRVGAKAAS